MRPSTGSRRSWAASRAIPSAVDRTGTPNAAASLTVTAQVTDNAGTVRSRQLGITINPPPDDDEDEEDDSDDDEDVIDEDYLEALELDELRSIAKKHGVEVVKGKRAKTYIKEILEAVEAGEERLRDEQIAAGQVVEERMEEKRAAPSSTTRDEEDFAPLFEKDEAEKFRAQWLEIQSRFVDDPSVSVKDADDLVADVIKNITRTFSDKRLSLEDQWKSGDKVSTEDLRVAMKRYRSFFDRLLTLKS